MLAYDSHVACSNTEAETKMDNVWWADIAKIYFRTPGEYQYQWCCGLPDSLMQLATVSMKSGLLHALPHE